MREGVRRGRGRALIGAGVGVGVELFVWLGGSTRTVARDLVPGGAAIPVTHESKVSYVYLRADDRLYRQIKPAAAAFAQVR